MTRQEILNKANKYPFGDFGLNNSDIYNILEKVNEEKAVTFSDEYSAEELELVSMHYFLDGILAMCSPFFIMRCGHWQEFCNEFLGIEPNVNLIDLRNINA
ncbi:MAG: hypothetical protein KBS82_05370 [Oscillospiraceae bacterium]|nr:hypothetical protein [Candidatus Limimonas egerieequi]